MESKWLEDFVSLAETRSFSRSAELRHVTQPAFSRRIQSLEAWLGTDLIDRTSYPTRLTAAGEVFYEQAVAMLGQINNTRALLRGKRPTAQTTIDFAVPHTLSLTYMPKWLSALESGFGSINTRLIALNVHDAVMTIVEGGCDLLLCYHHPRQPVQLDASRYDSSGGCALTVPPSARLACSTLPMPSATVGRLTGLPMCSRPDCKVSGSRSGKPDAALSKLGSVHKPGNQASRRCSTPPGITWGPNNSVGASHAACSPSKARLIKRCPSACNSMACGPSEADQSSSLKRMSRLAVSGCAASPWRSSNLASPASRMVAGRLSRHSRRR